MNQALPRPENQPPVSGGTIIKLVRTYGSTWGRIRADSSATDVFFNVASLVEPDEFAGLQEGQHVEFDEEQDRANGRRAINVRIVEAVS